MKKTLVMFVIQILFSGFITSFALSAQNNVPVSELKAEARDGQVFLTWKEAPVPDGSTFNIYVDKKPVKDVSKATLAAHHVQEHSARDWWEDPASFTKDVKHNEPVGFIIKAGTQRLNPEDGLFVYTLRGKEKGKLYFAVTVTDPKGLENKAVITGKNSLGTFIIAVPGPIKPVWQKEAPQPEKGAGKGMPLSLSLHGKGSVISNMEYLLFTDENMGWRAGLPVKFSVRIQKDGVFIRPNDRVWINRPHNEAGDGGMPAIWTFWYGYNSLIYNRELMSKGVPVNYTENVLLKILDFVSTYYQTDKNRWYCSGSSMGGCGTISFGLRHHELFAALHAHVPIVSFTYLSTGGNSAVRLEPSSWIGKIPEDLLTNEGVPLLKRMNGIEFLSTNKADLPYLFLVNGRNDSSIPWPNNPPFYKALSKASQGHAAFWDTGVHSTSGTKAPEDIKDWPDYMFRFRLDESYPAFMNTSSDKDPGNGDPAVGDSIGWINRGMDWKEIEDSNDNYSITILASFPGIEYPVKTDIRLRRIQNFRPKAGKDLKVNIGENQPVTIKVQSDGGIVIPGIIIPSDNGVRIRISPL